MCRSSTGIVQRKTVRETSALRVNKAAHSRPHSVRMLYCTSRALKLVQNLKYIIEEKQIFQVKKGDSKFVMYSYFTQHVTRARDRSVPFMSALSGESRDGCSCRCRHYGSLDDIVVICHLDPYKSPQTLMGNCCVPTLKVWWKMYFVIQCNVVYPLVTGKAFTLPYCFLVHMQCLHLTTRCQCVFTYYNCMKRVFKKNLI